MMSEKQSFGVGRSWRILDVKTVKQDQVSRKMYE